MGAARTIGVAAIAFLVAVADVPEGVAAWQPWTALAAAVAAIALATRETTRPMGAIVSLALLAGVAVGAAGADAPGQIPVGHLLVVALLLADLARHERPVIVAGVAIGAAVTAMLAEGLADDREAADVAFVVLLWGLALAVALALRWRQQAIEARVEQVRTAERERLARELHDVVAHHVSAIALTAEGARGVVGVDPNAVDRSLASIHHAAATTLDEMRRMVAILRDEVGGQPPRRLADLVATFDTVGPPRVTVTVADDVAADPSDPVEPSVPLVATVFRVVQEAVTNSRRHARDVANIAVDVRHDAGALVLTITDDGRPARPAWGTGYGLRGMRERVELVGGSCRSGPAATGGWIVEARLPCRGTR